MFRINNSKYINHYSQKRFIEENNTRYFSEFILCLKYLQVPQTIKFQNGKNKFIYQTEQLTRNNWKNLITENSQYSILIEYSEYNKKILLENNSKAQIIISPIFFVPEMKFNNNKEFDFVFIGGLNSRRQNILDKLIEKKYKVLIINNIFDFNLKYLEILKAKCLINIHADEDYKVFEFTRCAIPCYNNMIIISENCEGLEYEKNNPINKFIIERVIFCNYDDIIDTSIQHLNHKQSEIDYNQLQIISKLEIERINDEFKRY
jgi:hypothetical protein